LEEQNIDFALPSPANLVIFCPLAGLWFLNQFITCLICKKSTLLHKTTPENNND